MPIRGMQKKDKYDMKNSVTKAMQHTHILGQFQDNFINSKGLFYLSKPILFSL